MYNVQGLCIRAAYRPLGDTRKERSHVYGRQLSLARAVGTCRADRNAAAARGARVAWRPARRLAATPARHGGASRLERHCGLPQVRDEPQEDRARLIPE